MEQPSPLEALENQERVLEKTVGKGMEPEQLLRELTELAEKQNVVQEQRLAASEAWVSTEDPEAQQQARQASDEARAALEVGKRAFLQEASASLGGIAASVEGGADQMATAKTELENAEKAITEFSARQPLDAVSASYVSLMESYRSLLKAQIAKQDTAALAEEYDKKAAAYQELTKTNG